MTTPSEPINREWPIPDRDLQLLFYHLQQIDEILERVRMRDPSYKGNNRLTKPGAPP